MIMRDEVLKRLSEKIREITVLEDKLIKLRDIAFRLADKAIEEASAGNLDKAYDYTIKSLDLIKSISEIEYNEAQILKTYVDTLQDLLRMLGPSIYLHVYG